MDIEPRISFFFPFFFFEQGPFFFLFFNEGVKEMSGPEICVW